jgi:Fe-S oxidoreductase
VDRKLFEARLSLARHFFQHVVRRFLSPKDKDGVGLEQFLSHYGNDNIFEIAEHERERYHEFSHCIQCNICQPQCVMYRAIGYQQFPGPMVVAGALSRGLSELGTTSGVIYNCTLCRLCETTCPENAPIAEMVNFVRKYIYKYDSDLVPEPLKELCRVVKKRGAIFDEYAPDVLYEKNSAEYVLFLGCQSRFKQKHRAEAAISMLNQIGVDFTTVDEVCCGAPLAAAGCDDVSDLVRINIDLVRKKNTKKVITLCPHCLLAFYEGREYAEALEPMSITDLLPQLHPARAGKEIVTYHDPCMLGRVCGIYDEPRQALKQVGAKMVEMNTAREMASCCGNWGGLGRSNRKAAEAIAARRLEDARKNGAEVLLTECPWCLDILKSTTLPGGKPRVRSVIEYLQDPEM